MTADICIVILCWPDQFPKIKPTTNLLSKSLLETAIKYAYACTSNVQICCHDEHARHIENYLLELLTTNNLELCDIKSSKSIFGCLESIQWSGDVVFLNPYVVSNISLQTILREYKSITCDALIPLVDNKVVEKLEKLGGRANFGVNHDRLKWLIGLSKDQICYAMLDDVKLKVHESILNVFPQINFTRQYEMPPVMICKNWIFQWIMNQKYTDLHDVMIDLIEAQHNPHLLSTRNILKYYNNDVNCGIDEALKLSTTQASSGLLLSEVLDEEASLTNSIAIMKKIKVLTLIVPITQSNYIFDLQFEENVFEYIKMNSDASRGQNLETGEGSAIGNDCFLDDFVQIKAKTVVKKSIIGKYVRIGANCRVVNSIILDNCVIEDGCEIQSCFILPGNVITQNKIQAQVINN